MATEQASTGKTCAICGQDCSNKERIKDASGRYFCKSCVEARRKTAAAPGAPKAAGAAKAAASAPPAGAKPPPVAPKVSGFDALEEMARLESKAEVLEDQSGACPNCRKPMPMGAILCAECGFNRRIGRQVNMRAVATAPKAATKGGVVKTRPIGGGGGGGLGLPEGLQKPWVLFAGPVAVFAILFFLAKSDPQHMKVVFSAVHGLFGLAVGIWMLVAAFSESVGTGVMCLCIPFYSFYFLFGVNDNNYLKAAWCAAIVGQIMGVALIF